MLIISLLAIGQLNEATGRRDVFFNLNGEPRVVSIEDTSTTEGGSGNGSKKNTTAVRPKANPQEKSQVGAPMSGVVVDVRVKVGSQVKVGDPLAVLSAMSKT